MQIVIDSERGEVTVVGHGEHDQPLLAELGLHPVRIERGGHLYPAHPLKRLVFRLVRQLPVPALHGWTRRWRGAWVVVLVADGRLLGPFPTRAEAMAAEETAVVQSVVAAGAT